MATCMSGYNILNNNTKKGGPFAHGAPLPFFLEVKSCRASFLRRVPDTGPTYALFPNLFLCSQLNSGRPGRTGFLSLEKSSSPGTPIFIDELIFSFPFVKRNEAHFKTWGCEKRCLQDFLLHSLDISWVRFPPGSSLRNSLQRWIRDRLEAKT